VAASNGPKGKVEGALTPASPGDLTALLKAQKPVRSKAEDNAIRFALHGV
jgi:hypothetical protein